MNGFRTSKLFSALVALVMIAAAIVIPLSGNINHSHAASSSSQDSWQIVSNPNQNNSGYVLKGTAAISSNDVWAVGAAGNSNTLTMHWDGSSWTTVTSPNPSVSNTLTSVTAISSNDVWAVGNTLDNSNFAYTLTMHWDGSSWTTVTSPNPTSYNFLNSITAVSSNDVWAVGYTEDPNTLIRQTLTMHWDGSSWTTVTSPNPDTNNLLLSVKAVSSNDVWAVGYAYGNFTQTLTMHWDGSSWTTVTSPNQSSVSNTLTSVTAISSNDVWAVGYALDSNTNTNQTLTMHWDGSSWTTVTSPNQSSQQNNLQSVTAISSNDVWAVGSAGINGSGYQTLTMHWDGSSWTTVTSPNPTSYNFLNSATAVSSNDVWAVGYTGGSTSTGTLIEQYAPSTTPTPSPTLSPSPSPTPSPSPSPSPTPTVTMQKVWTADGNNKTKTSFTPGDAIHYRAQVNNANSTTVTAAFTFLATGAQQIFSWSGSKSVASGASTITKASTVPFDAPVGTYTLTVTVTYNGVSSQGQSQFTVTRPYNSAINNLSQDNKSVQSETAVAVSSVNSPGLTVMVGYNDYYGATASPPNPGEGIGYSYSFDGGTSWTDAGALPVYVDSTGHAGYNVADPGLTVDKNGTFYFTQVAYTSGESQEFIAMSKCTYSSSTGKIGCGRPKPVSNFDSTTPNSGGYLYGNDKPAVAYDPVSNRVYVTWTELTLYNNAPFQAVTKLRYYDVSAGKFSPTTYTLSTFAWANGTAPVVTSSGLVYVFYLRMNTQQQGQSIVYSTFNNGTITTNTLDNIYPAAPVVNSCGSEAFTTEAFTLSTAARTAEFPAAAIDNSGNIDVVWEGATTNGGISTIFVATLPSGGGTPTIQYLPNPSHLIQWQPAVAVAGGTNTVAVTYFQVVNTSSGYQIVREQVTAPASSVPTFGAAKMISTVPWKADQTNPTFQTNSGLKNCYMGDYSSSVSTPTANVVWSYWGDNRNVTSGIGPQPDIYGLSVNVP